MKHQGLIKLLSFLVLTVPLATAQQVCSSQEQLTPRKTKSLAPQVVDSVDLKRYMGQWYEIATIPMFFERKCVGNTWATYHLLPNGQVEVKNSCEIKSGQRIASIGRAKVIDSKSNAKLKVTFLNLLGWRFGLGGDYWIIDLDKDYRYAVIGHPSSHYGWILSRTPALSMPVLNDLSKKLTSQGYDPCLFITMPQLGGFVEKRPLCHLVK